MEPDPRPTERSDNDQQLAADLAHYERVLTAARDDDDAQAVLSGVGYGSERLDGLLATVASAQTAYEARTAGKSAAEAADEAKETADASARSSYSAFRKIARALFRGDDDALTALGLNDPEARALDPFVTQARAGYGAVAGLPGEGPQTMAEAGYTADRLAALAGEVQALQDAERDRTAARGRAKKTTRVRDVEGAAARTVYSTFRDIARTVLPPDLRDRVGLD